MLAVTDSFARTSDSPSVASYTMPRHWNSSKTFTERLLYQSMAITRRAVLKGFAGATAAVVAGGGAYGYFDERLQVVVERTDVPVAGLPSALSGVRIGFLSDVHC